MLSETNALIKKTLRVSSYSTPVATQGQRVLCPACLCPLDLAPLMYCHADFQRLPSGLLHRRTLLVLLDHTSHARDPSPAQPRGMCSPVRAEKPNPTLLLSHRNLGTRPCTSEPTPGAAQDVLHGLLWKWNQGAKVATIIFPRETQTPEECAPEEECGTGWWPSTPALSMVTPLPTAPRDDTSHRVQAKNTV